MALSNKGTVVSINSNLVPSGYTLPTVVTFDDRESEYPNYAITIAKSAIENANEVTAFTALVAAITAAVTALITADYDTAGLTVDVYANWKTVVTNTVVGGALYKNTAVSYTCTCDIFVKTS